MSLALVCSVLCVFRRGHEPGECNEWLHGLSTLPHWDHDPQSPSLNWRTGLLSSACLAELPELQEGLFPSL